MALQFDLSLTNISSFTVRLTEAERVFDLIQQNAQNPQPFLSTQNIENFTKRFFSLQSAKTFKIVQQINKQSAEMNWLKFSTNLAKCTGRTELSSNQSLNIFYRQIKDFFNVNFEKPLQRQQKWDFEELGDKKRLENIQQFYLNIQPYIETMETYTFQNYLDRINYCLSISTVLSQQQKVYKIVATFIHPTVVQHISSFLNSMAPFVLNTNQVQNEIISDCQNVLRYFRCISYLYTACKHGSIKQKMKITFSCLFYKQTYQIIESSLNVPQNRIKRQVSICLALLSKYVDEFSEWILDNIDSNFIPLLQKIEGLTDDQGLDYALICLRNIILKYQERPMMVNIQPLIDLIHKFSYYILKTSQLLQTQKQCLLLIGDLLKICPVNFNQIEELKITSKVFLTEIKIQNQLVPPALRIIEVALMTGMDQLINAMINEKGFLYLIENHLGSKDSQFFYQLWHVVHLLSYSRVTYLIEKGIMEKIVKTMFQAHSPVLVSIGSKITFNSVQQALQNDSILETLYQKFSLFDQLIPFFFKKCFEKNSLLDLFTSSSNPQQNQIYVPNYYYFDKSMFLTIFKTLYCLALGISRRNKRFAFSKKLNQQIVKAIGNILEGLFNFENRPMIQIILREKIKIVNNKKIKLQNGIQLYKMINLILEEMTYNMEGRPIQFLKIISQQKKSFCNNLLKSQFFELHELEIQGIPIYITIEFEFNDVKFKRQIPHKFELSSLKNYLKQYVANVAQIKSSEIKDIVLKYGPNRIVENQVQYRAILNKEIQKKGTDFYFQIVDYKYKQKRDNLGGSIVGQNEHIGLQRSQRLSNSFVGRQNTQTSRIMPNNGYTTLRENPSQHDPRLSYHSPNNFAYSYGRDKSPAFGDSGGHRNV